MRTNHKEAAKIVVRVVKRKGRATWRYDIKPAMERAGLNPSTFAIWNSVRAGHIRRVGRGTYQFAHRQ